MTSPAEQAVRIAVLRVPGTRRVLSEDLALMRSLAGVFGFMLENLRLQRKRQEQDLVAQDLRLQTSKSELKALRAQINPHFLFNALNAIASLIHTDPARADEAVEQLAEVFRYTLRRSESEWAPLDQELAFARAYLDVEQARFGQRLTCTIDSDHLPPPPQVPSMLLQTLIENAVKHGVLPTARPGPHRRHRANDERGDYGGSPRHGSRLRRARSRATGRRGLRPQERARAAARLLRRTGFAVAHARRAGRGDHRPRRDAGGEDGRVIRAVLVDDEPPARVRMRQLLDAAGGVTVVGEAGSAVEAREVIRETRPDLLFLDVEMPEVRGTALAGSLPEPRPFIVFATAYEHFALEAIGARGHRLPAQADLPRQAGGHARPRAIALEQARRSRTRRDRGLGGAGADVARCIAGD